MQRRVIIESCHDHLGQKSGPRKFHINHLLATREPGSTARSTGSPFIADGLFDLERPTNVNGPLAHVSSDPHERTATFRSSRAPAPSCGSLARSFMAKYA